MLRSLISGISGLKSFQKQMDVIGNNIANVNTTGFKSSKISFADNLSQKVGSSGGGEYVNQIGSGVDAANILNKWNDGGYKRTDAPQDLAISGNGFFVVSDPNTGEQYVTRAGEFIVDKEGYLSTPSGQRVQGFNNMDLDTVGDLRIDVQEKPEGAAADAAIKSFAIGNDGKINLFLSDGTNYTRGQVLLQDIKSTGTLTKEGNNLFGNWKNAGPLDWNEDPGVPGAGGVGQVASGMVELSNVELANEFSSMITTQRAYQASARVISTSDEMLQELVNLKR